jgi:flagellar hook assembly protein FlgD
VPEASYLAQNYPNPLNPMTRLEYGLAAPARVSLRVYDASGRLVRALVEADRAAGRHAELWDGRDASGRLVASGIYFYRIEAGAFSETRKSVLAR